MFSITLCSGPVGSRWLKLGTHLFSVHLHHLELNHTAVVVVVADVDHLSPSFIFFSDYFYKCLSLTPIGLAYL